MVYAAWNEDARDVASWRIVGGSSPTQAQTAIAGAARAGFETAIAVPSAPPYLAVQALDAQGQPLGTSPALAALVR